jgi:hypothetical protein
MVKEVDHKTNVRDIFPQLVGRDLRLKKAESSTIEFKEAFNWANRSRYAKSVAAFANNKGGYLIFGVTNKPRILVGLTTNNFDDLDEAIITAYLNSLFAPEIRYEKFNVSIKRKKVGFVYVHPATNKPVVAIKDDGDVREAEIYYRYNARNDKVKYPELKGFFDLARHEERKGWQSLFARVAKIGVGNAGVMDMANGTIEGNGGTLLIDEKLLPKLKFIREGTFSEKGQPTLRLVGDVQPVVVTRSKAGRSTQLRLTDDPQAPAVREESILEQYPLGYFDLVKLLSNRYTDLKTNTRFHKIRKPLLANPKYCRSRYLDPKNPNSSRKDFYSHAIVKEFDKHYTRA